MSDWAEFERLTRAGVSVPIASVLVHERMRRRLRRPTGGRRRNPREHGSERGYQQHRVDGTPRCAPCRAAHSSHVQVQKAAA